MSKIFLTADLHFNHANIIKFSKRPFTDVADMNQQLTDNWNSVVGQNDTVYILGDIGMGGTQHLNELLNLLNGTKYLIKGNHDKFKHLSGLRWVKDYYKLNYNGEKIIMFHYPIQTWDCQHYNAIHCYGHVHNNDHTNIVNAFNVGVDVCDYKPVLLDDIIKRKVNQNWFE